jgi:hypothetical protein
LKIDLLGTSFGDAEKPTFLLGSAGICIPSNVTWEEHWGQAEFVLTFDIPLKI